MSFTDQQMTLYNQVYIQHQHNIHICQYYQQI